MLCMDIGKSAEQFRGQEDMSEKTELLKKALLRTKQEVAKVIIGQEPVVDKALIAIFSGNHALIEGVPGVAKTLLVRTLAHVMRCDSQNSIHAGSDAHRHHGDPCF